MRILAGVLGGVMLLPAGLASAQAVLPPVKTPAPTTIIGFRDAATQLKLDRDFLAVPDAALAGEELKTLTAAPHFAGSKEDFATAQYVARKFREAGLETRIVPYRVMMNVPKKIRVTAVDATGKQIMSGPTAEHVSADAFQDDKRIAPAFHAYSPSGDITADAVYANYGRPQDFAELDAKHISVRGKIVIVRYGEDFRGVKVYLAAQHGAVGVIIYSDPADDGYFRGEKYPDGPYRPATGVQRGSVQYLFKYPGDPTTPGFASTPNLPDSKRIALKDAANQPTIPSTPLSYQDAAPILNALGGAVSPKQWQGALPFTYHMGPGPVRVHIVLREQYALHTIWDVTGKIAGTEYPDDWVVVGNHRDAWVYGAVDPGSGTAAMLEAVHGVGALLQQGWKPRRSVIFASWDGEEPGLVGSTEWVEQHAAQLSHAVAYFNVDVGVSGPNFEAAAVPSLKPFVTDVTKLVPSPQGGTVYDAWQREQKRAAEKAGTTRAEAGSARTEAGSARTGAAMVDGVTMEDLGSGSDFTPFFQHAGVPSTYISSNGPYGVYHSTFDDFDWYTRFADPNFAYLQQQARVLGLEAITMADADVLPYDYALYGEAVLGYLRAAKKKAFVAGLGLDFSPALAAAERFHIAGAAVGVSVAHPEGALRRENENARRENELLRQVEDDLLSPAGLPQRPWYKHTIYAPGEFTGYSAVVIPGVNEAIDAKDGALAGQQLAVLTEALKRAAVTLDRALALR